MSKAQVQTLFMESAHLEGAATTPEQYRQAFIVARKALELTEAGSLIHANCLNRVACLAADLGDFKTAIRFGLPAVHLIPHFEEAAPLVPFAHFALGRAYSRTGNHRQAITHLRIALSAASGELAERIRLTLARALARSGRISEAWEVLHGATEYHLPGKLQSARALILAKSGSWVEANREAKEALRRLQTGDFRLYDTIELAETLLVLKTCALAMGQNAEAATWFVKALRLLVRWSESLLALLSSTLRREGGVYLEATPSRGPAGHARCGLRGAVG